jgi:hypothetical protein
MIADTIRRLRCFVAFSIFGAVAYSFRRGRTLDAPIGGQLFGAVPRLPEIFACLGDRPIALTNGVSTPGNRGFYTEDGLGASGRSRQRS